MRALVACALFAAACAAGAQSVSSRPPPGQEPPPTVVTLENAKDGGTAALRLGDELKLVLDLDGIYEYAWELQAPIAPTLAQIGERIYVNKGVNLYDIALGGFSLYRFRAEQPGKVALVLSKRSRADGRTLATVHYEVTVE